MRRLAPAKLAAGYARNGMGAIRASGSGCRPGHRACYRTHRSKPEFTQPQWFAVIVQVALAAAFVVRLRAE